MELYFTYKQNIFFAGYYYTLMYMDIYKQPLCKLREDYTLLCLELSQNCLLLMKSGHATPGPLSPSTLLRQNALHHPRTCARLVC